MTSLTIADFFNAPVVDRLDVSGYTGQAGETIVVQAHDDFEVTGVTVQIAAAGGQLWRMARPPRIRPTAVAGRIRPPDGEQYHRRASDGDGHRSTGERGDEDGGAVVLAPRRTRTCPYPASTEQCVAPAYDEAARCARCAQRADTGRLEIRSWRLEAVIDERADRTPDA